MRFLITLAALSVAIWAADNSIGTWKRNIDKSKINNPNSPKSFTTVREAFGSDGVKVTNSGVQADGKPFNATYTAKYDGKEVAVTGDAPYDTIAIKQIDANTFTTTARSKKSKYATTGRIVVAKDGKSYTNTTKGTGEDGKPVTQVLVYEKQ